VVEQKLEVGATAVTRQTSSRRTIAIAKGAVIDGEVTVTSASRSCSSKRARRELGLFGPAVGFNSCRTRLGPNPALAPTGDRGITSADVSILRTLVRRVYFS